LLHIISQGFPKIIQIEGKNMGKDAHRMKLNDTAKEDYFLTWTKVESRIM
jgi:hypothetical protein